MAIVRLVSGNGVASGLIKWYTNSPFSHVEFWTPNGYLGSQAPEGVMLRPFNYTGFDSESFREYKLPDAAELALMQWCTAQVGKGYDWLAILALPLHRDWRSEDDWYCSEFVAAAFDHVGYPLFQNPQDVTKITPRDVSLSPLLVPCATPAGAL